MPRPEGRGRRGAGDQGRGCSERTRITSAACPMGDLDHRRVQQHAQRLSTYSPDAIKNQASTIKNHLRNRCGFGRTAHATPLPYLYVRQTQKLRPAERAAARRGAAGCTRARCRARPRSRRARPPSAPPINHRCRSLRRSPRHRPASKRLRGWESDEEDDEA